MDEKATETIDLQTLNLEDRAEKAWYLARALSEGQPINAAHGIKAAAIVGSVVLVIVGVLLVIHLATD